MLCWIDPSGKIHPVKSHGHAAFARRVLDLPHDTGVNESILLLARKGWLHIGFTEFVSVYPYKSLPESQYTVLHKLAKTCENTLTGDVILSYMFS